MTHAELEAKIEALESILGAMQGGEDMGLVTGGGTWKVVIELQTKVLRHQLAALQEEPAPWTARERRLYAALETIPVDLINAVENSEAPAKIFLSVESCKMIASALADIPPPDPRDAALETLYKLSKVDYGGKIVIRFPLPPEADWDGVTNFWTMDVFLAAIRAAREGK